MPESVEQLTAVEINIIHLACEQIATNPFRIRKDGRLNRIDVNSLRRDVELLQSVLSSFETE